MYQVIAVVLIFALVLGLAYAASVALTERERSIGETRLIKAEQDRAERQATLAARVKAMEEGLALLVVCGVGFALLFGVPAAAGGGISLAKRTYAWATSPVVTQSRDGEVVAAMLSSGVAIVFRRGLPIPVVVNRQGDVVALQGIPEKVLLRLADGQADMEWARRFADVARAGRNNQLLQTALTGMAQLQEARHTVTVKPPPAQTSIGAPLRVRPNDEASARALKSGQT